MIIGWRDERDYVTTGAQIYTGPQGISGDVLSGWLNRPLIFRNRRDWRLPKKG